MRIGLCTADENGAPVRDPRRRILNAATAMFARHGFHGASMQQICTEAGMSPGALYRYFPSKDAIIAAIAEEDRQRHAVAFTRLAEAPSFVDALLTVGQELLSEEQGACGPLVPEVLAEIVRNPDMRALFEPNEKSTKAALRLAMDRAVERGEIDATLDLEAVSVVLHAIGDGLATRLAIDPTVKLETLMPTLEALLRRFFAPQGVSGSDRTRPETKPHATAAESAD